MNVDTVESDVDDNSTSATRRIPEHKLSCDQCRQRKIKCDRVNPCGPCQRNQIHCSYPAGFKPRAKRQRALVSDSYESKLNTISQKLDHISLAIDSIASPLPQVHGSSSAVHTALSSQVTPISHTASPSEAARTKDDAISDLEGDVTLATQATFATDFLQQVVDSNQVSHVLPDIKTSLDALRKILTDKNDDNGEPKLINTQQLLSPARQGGFQLPPIHLAMLAIQRLRETPKLKFFWCIEFESVGQFVEYFMTVYFGKPTLADLIITHAGLQGLLLECGKMELDQLLEIEFRSQGMLCRQNLEHILAGLPFNLPCTPDYILALFLASTYYLDRCRISMSWNCLAAAAQMCQTLGFARETIPKPETREAKQRRAKLVWCINLLDKMLALRLSRPSLIRAGEITLNFEALEATGSDGLTPILAKWAKFCDLQGRIYDDVYSPKSLSQSDVERESHVRDLAADMQRLFHSRSLAELKERYFEALRQGVGYAISEMFRRSDKIAYHSMLCLVYRAVKPTSSSSSAFCDECLAAAKDGLEEHRICLSILKEAQTEIGIFGLYVQWGLMAVPLVPFVVLFCHAIETCDPAHLESLATVIETVDMIPPDLPDVYRKQLYLFKLMYDVASNYVSSRSRNPPMHASGQIPVTPFEMLFAEAGIPLPNHMNMQANRQGFQNSTQHGDHMAIGDFLVGQGGNVVDDRSFNQGTELGNWFEQNQEIFMMLDNNME